MRFLMLNIMAFCLMLIATSAHAHITPATEYEPKTEDIKSPGNPGTSATCEALGYSKPVSSDNNAVCAKMKIYTTGGSTECWACVCPEGYIHKNETFSQNITRCKKCTIKKNGSSIDRYKCE